MRNLATTSASTTTSSSSSSSSSTAAVAGTAVDVTTVTTTTSLATTNTTTTHVQEVAQHGFDGEIGWRVPVFAPAATTQLRVYAGGYSFTGNGAAAVDGPRGRLDLIIDQVPYLWNGARLQLDAEVQHDKPRGTQAFAGLRLRIPLQIFGERPAELTAMERRMEDPIIRDVDVVSQSHSTTASSTASSTTTSSSTLVETASETSGGAAFTVLNSATTSGAQLPGAITAAGANSTVLLSGTFNTTATTTLQSGQTVTGSLTVVTPSGKTATVTTNGTIAATSGARINAVTMGTNSTVSNLTITSTGGNGAVGVVNTGVTGATIANNTITATDNGSNTTGAVQLLGGSTVLRNNTLSASGSFTDTGALFANSATATVTGNTFSATQSGAASPRTIDLQNNNTFNSGSTGNTLKQGSCFNNGGTVTGSIGLAGGATCP